MTMAYLRWLKLLDAEYLCLVHGFIHGTDEGCSLCFLSELRGLGCTARVQGYDSLRAPPSSGFESVLEGVFSGKNNIQ